jgi:hypothetical protein
MPDSLPVFWRGEIVGHVQGLRLDNFHAYGDWIPGDSDVARLFLGLAANPDDEPAMVHIGSVHSRF